MLNISVVSIHPKFIQNYFEFGVCASVINSGTVKLKSIDLRDFAVDKHGSVDSRPYGGGDGMVLRPEPLAEVIKSFDEKPHVILTSPVARAWTREDAKKFSSSDSKIKNILFVCGRFGGVDERFIENYVDEEVSIGDFIVSGGELPVLMIIDSILRFIPGALGHPDSATNDSYEEGLEGLAEYPLYSRPQIFEGKEVPEVLISGNHQEIQKWKKERSIEKTIKSQKVHTQK